MSQSVDIAKSYPGETIGRMFASADLRSIRDDLTTMLRDAGLAGKVAPLIIPNDNGQASVTLWGRVPNSDSSAVSQLLEAAKAKHGSKFTASDSGRVGPDKDIIVAPYSMHSEERLPPRATR